MGHESDGDTNFNGHTRYSHRRIGTGTGGLGKKRTSGDHLNCSILEIVLNTKKSPGDLRETCCHSDSTERPSANAGMKNSKSVK